MLALGALFLLVTVVMLRPTPGTLDDTVPSNLGDPVLVTWILRYGSHAITSDPGDIFDAPIFWPHEDTFTYSESMLPVAPIYGAVHAVVGDDLVAVNLVILGFSVFNLVATYALARYLLRDGSAAILTALAFSFSAYVMARTGHPHLLPVGVFALGYLAVLRLLDRPNLRNAVLAGLANAVAFLTSLYYGAIWAVCLGVLLVGWLVVRRFHVSRSTILWLGVMVVVSAVPILPVASVYSRRAVERPLVPQWGLNPRDVVTPAPDSYLYGWASGVGAPSDPIEHTYFPGLVPAALAVFGCVVLVRSLRRRTRAAEAADGRDPADALAPRSEMLAVIALAGVVSVVLAIGPDFAGYSAPFRFFHDHVPGFDGIRVASRLAVPGLLAGALLAGLGARELLGRMDGRRAAMVAVGLGAVILLEHAAPVPRAHVDRSDAAMAVYEELEGRARGAVVELPIMDPSENGYLWGIVEPSRMLRATTDWNPRVNGYSGDVPPDYVENARALNAFPASIAIARAEQLGVRYVILHTSELGAVGTYPEAEAAELVAQVPPGSRVDRFGNAWLVELAAG